MSNHFSGFSSASKSRNVEEPALVFRFNDEVGSGSDVIRDVLLDRGMIEYQPGLHKENDWNLWWKNSRFRPSTYSQLKPWQRLNHHPNSKGCFNDITIKDGLLRNMRRMKGIYNGVFDYTPEAFHLPREERLFKEMYRSMAEDSERRKDNYWIYKPSDLSRGRGIFLVDRLCDFRYGSKAIVQRYISRPFLICGYKFDLRLYVVVVSYKPLIIYILKEGLTRFSTEKFDLNDLNNIYSHLTNSSINKNGPSYTTKKIGIGSGCKWSFKQLRYYLYQNDIEDRKLWSEISVIVILTILSQASSVPTSVNCFELFGFDIIFDHNLKPWLLEVNFSPAMSQDCSVDVQVKRSLIHSICDLLSYNESDAIGYNRFHCIHHSDISSNYSFIKESRHGRRPKTQGSEGTSSVTRRLSCGSYRSAESENYSTTDSGLSSASSLSGQRSLSKERPGTSVIACSSSELNNNPRRYPTATISGGMFNVERARMRRHERQQRGDMPQLGAIAEDHDDSDSDSIHWNSGSQPYRLPSLTNSLSNIRQKPKSNTSSTRSGLFSSNKKTRKRPKTSANLSQTKNGVKHQFDWESRQLEQQEMINRYCRMVSGENDSEQTLFTNCKRRLESGKHSDEQNDDNDQENKPTSSSKPTRREHLREHPIRQRTSDSANPMYGAKSIRLHTGHCTQLPPLPECFGEMKLLFPFNEASRRAATHLEEKSIVRETVRLLRHRAKEMQKGESISDPSVIDIPEVWPPL